MKLNLSIYLSLAVAILLILSTKTWNSGDEPQNVDISTIQTTPSSTNAPQPLEPLKKNSNQNPVKSYSSKTGATSITNGQNDTSANEAIPIDTGQDMNNPATSTTQETTAIDRATCEKLKSDITELAKNDPAFQEQGFWLTDPGTKDSIDYHSYTVDQLMPLAKNGDRNAQHVLGEKLAVKDPKQAKHWLKEAAINGYTTSLISLFRTTVNQYYLAKYKKAETEESIDNINRPPSNQKPEDYLVEMLAWLTVAQKRLGAEDKIKEFQFEDHQYTPDQVLAADQMATELYNELETERLNRGLGRFENRTFGFSQEHINLYKQCSKLASKQP